MASSDGAKRRITTWMSCAAASGRVLGALVVAGAFAASRAMYHARGVRFDTSSISYFAQLLDRHLLRDRLGASLLHLHAQPPLYNLLTGVALKIAPHRPGLVLAPVFMACGLYVGLCLYSILLRLRLPVIVAAVVASAVVASPPFVLYESWYFYPHLNVAWLLGAVAWLAAGRGRPGPEMAIAAAHLAGLSLTRSLFHPLFFGLAVAVVVVLTAAGARRRALVCFTVPGLLLVVWCAKNEVLFGFFGTSSWASRNVYRAVVTALGSTRVRAEARRGRLSPATGMSAFEPGDRNLAAFSLADAPTGVPALDTVDKQRPSALPINYNHRSYPPSAHFYAEDARLLIATYPRAYLAGLYKQNVPGFLAPVDKDGFFRLNVAAISAAAHSFDELDGSRAAHRALALGLALALCTALARTTPAGERAVLALALVAIGWVSAAAIFGEFGESSRFRYKVLWLAWTLALSGYAAALRWAAWGLEDAIDAVRARRPAALPPAPPASTLSGTDDAGEMAI